MVSNTLGERRTASECWREIIKVYRHNRGRAAETGTGQRLIEEALNAKQRAGAEIKGNIHKKHRQMNGAK